MSANAAFARVAAAIDGVLEKAKRSNIETTHVAMCAFWHSLIGVDSDQRPTTKVLGWADTRSREYSAVVKNKFDETEIHDRTGAHLHSSFWPAKLLWLRREMPDAFARTQQWLSFSDYVALRLFGKAMTTVSMASATGVFDQRKCDWDRPLLRFLGIKVSQLPLITDGMGRLSMANARRWPQLRDTAWIPAVGDGAADHVGACGIGKGRASLMIGTSAAMRVAFKGDPPSKIPDGLWAYRIDRKRVIVGGALSDGGNLYDKLRRELRLPKAAEREMPIRGAAAHGLIILPFFFGERSTGYREDAKGAIVGSEADIDGIDLLQAAMEGVAFRLAEIHDRLKKVGPIQRIVASGGALRASPVWTQIVADVLGRDLDLTSDQESASRGSVLLGLESLGKIESIEKRSFSEGSKLEYHPTCNIVYRKARRQHQSAYKKQ
jgi:gluconokinase